MVTQWFLPLAEAARKSKGMPDLPLIVVPHPFDTIPEAEVLAAADEVFEKAVGSLIKAIASQSGRDR